MPRRRAPGLRREELAGLAGVSVDYLSRLEQGRATNPSPRVLAALARALRLSDEERRHLYLVAGQAPPGAGTIDRHLTPGVQRMLDRLEEMAVVVYDATWELVAWNPLGAALVGDLTRLDGPRAQPRLAPVQRRAPRASAASAEDDARFERELVADLHAAVGKYPDDERLAALVADLRAEQRALRGALGARARSPSAPPRRKTIEHPEVGPITVDCDVLNVARSNLRLIVYSAAPGTRTPRSSPCSGSSACRGWRG